LSNRNNKQQDPNVEVVLPAGGSNPTVTSGTVSTGTGNTKQDLKNQISTLKAQQKETAKNIKAAEKQLKALSKPKKKEDIQIVKKKNSKKSNGKK
jgi:uncharacterized protein involved in exopolysaccharide biosynthesis